MTQTCSIVRSHMTEKSKRGLGVLWIALAMMIVVLTPRMWGQDNATITDRRGHHWSNGGQREH